MKLLKKILLFIPILLILAILVRLFISSGNQKVEFAYHDNLPKTIELTSEAFVNHAKMPTEYTGKGSNTSPALQWNNLPADTKSIVILVVDYDAPAPYLKLLTIDHWSIFNIPNGIASLQKGITTADLLKMGATVGINIANETAYTGPQPPLGVHEYFFRIYALNTPQLEVSNPTKAGIMAAMKGKVLAYGELVGTF